METYSFLRELADSWVLVLMFAFLIGTYIWAFMPSQHGARDDASQIPFRNDAPPRNATCDGACAGCAAKSVAGQTKGGPHVRSQS